jgi:HEAT repeat protein
MPISYAELKAKLDVDEPNYPVLAEMAAGAIHHLRKLAASADVSLASKAVSLAGIMGDVDCIGIVGSASKSRDVRVRVAAAHAAGLLPDSSHAARVVNKLLDDKDVGVVKLAARAAARLSDPGVVTKARRASKRMHATVRAITAKKSASERSASMTRKTGMKAGTATKAKATRKGSTRAAGIMPAGAMTGPPKGAKAGKMPTGTMN